MPPPHWIYPFNYCIVLFYFLEARPKPQRVTNTDSIGKTNQRKKRVLEYDDDDDEDEIENIPKRQSTTVSNK